MLKRFVYFIYYLKELDFSKVRLFSDYVRQEFEISKVKQWTHIIKCSFKYNISILDYYLFKFYDISKKDMKSYAGTGFMYEYQLLMNPKKSRKILENKLEFLKAYRPFIKHGYISLADISSDKTQFDKLLSNDSKKIVLKDSVGQCGRGIEVRNCNEFNALTLIERLKKTGNDFVEDFVQQHQKLNELSPSGLNTIRIITQLNKKNEVDILGARLRITINSPVDNLAAGNIAASVNIETGIVDGPGVYSDITKKDEVKHPVTGVMIKGFQIPFWKQSLNLVKEAALSHKENRSIGWDVAITDNGPDLIEANHDWCKLLWQLPVKKGLRPVLEKHKEEYSQEL